MGVHDHNKPQRHKPIHKERPQAASTASFIIDQIYVQGIAKLMLTYIEHVTVAFRHGYHTEYRTNGNYLHSATETAVYLFCQKVTNS